MNIDIIQPQTVIAAGIKSVLTGQPGIGQIRVFDSEKAFLEMEMGYSPDLLIVDTRQTGIYAAEMLKRLKEKCGYKVKVIVFSIFFHANRAIQVLKNGAGGILSMWHTEREELVEAVHEVAGGRMYIGEGLRNGLLENYIGLRRRSASLTTKEMRIMQGLCMGYTINEMTEQFALSASAINYYIKSIKNKTGIRERSALIQYAINNGIYNVADMPAEKLHKTTIPG